MKQALWLRQSVRLCGKTSSQIEKQKCLLNQKYRIDSLIEQLMLFGYKRFDIVGERGEFYVI